MCVWWAVERRPRIGAGYGSQCIGTHAWAACAAPHPSARVSNTVLSTVGTPCTRHLCGTCGASAPRPRPPSPLQHVQYFLGWLRFTGHSSRGGAPSRGAYAPGLPPWSWPMRATPPAARATAATTAVPGAWKRLGASGGPNAAAAPMFAPCTCWGGGGWWTAVGAWLVVSGWQLSCWYATRRVLPLSERVLVGAVCPPHNPPALPSSMRKPGGICA